MGSIALPAVLPVSPGTVDDAREIGAFSVSHEVTAMRVAPAGGTDDSLTYVEEIPITVGLRWCIVEYKKKQHYRWWRLEVKVKVGADRSAIQPGHTLSIAMSPYSSTWVQRAPFRAANRRGRDVPTLDSPAAILKWIEEEFPYDFWETGQYLTTGISEPELPLMEDIRNRHDASWVFGVCADANANQALFDSPEVKEWLRKTKDGTFYYTVFRGKERMTLPVRDDEMKNEASSRMWLAVCQALAGPGPDEPSKEWIGKQVTEKVHYLYGNHLTHLDQQLRNARGRGL